MKPIINLISINLTPQEIKRFYTKFEEGRADECWPYKDTPCTWGYGRFSIRSNPRIRIQAHRLAFFLRWRIDPEDWNVCHECDNPICVNWNHLFIGTQHVNMADKVVKKRQAIGEKNGWSSLTESDIKTIRQMHQNKSASCKDMASKFGINVRHVYKIINRQVWDHV